MAAGPALPEVVLLDPPAIVAGVDTAVEVHLSAPPPADTPTCLALFKNGQPLPRTPLAAQSETVVRTQIEAATPSVIYACVSSHDGREMGAKVILLALPGPVCDEVCGLFRGSVDHVRRSDVDYRARTLGVSEAQMAALNASDLLTRTRQAVWRDSFQQLSKDMASFLEHLWSHREAELPDAVSSDLHTLLQYLLKNEAWETGAFLLRAGLETGVPIAVCGSVLSEQDVAPGSLQAMAERLRGAFGFSDPGEG